jgi:Uma2 family endonuclease
MTTAAIAPFTYEDLLRMEDDGHQYEILEGELVLNASPIPRHQMIAGRLYLVIQNYLDISDVGSLFFAPLDAVLSPINVLQPDLLFIRKERAAIITATNVSGAPDLVVEILSESTRKKDETRKRRIYEQFGVGEYWIVDPIAETVRLYERAAANYRVADTVLTSPLFPGLEIALAKIFA